MTMKEVRLWHYVNGSLRRYGRADLPGGTPASTVPVPPTIAAVAAATQVTVTWAKPADGGSPITGYTLQRQIYASNGTTVTTAWATINSPSAATTTYTDTGRTNGLVYGYRLLATNTVGSSAYSTEKKGSPVAAPTTNLPWYGHLDTRNRGVSASNDMGWFDVFDDTLKAQLTSPPAHVGQFVHSYSGTSIPTSFASSSVAGAQSRGIGAMLNTKWGWNDFLAGNADSRVISLMNSWPVGVPGEITWGHEPENDTENGGPGVNNTSSYNWAVTRGNAQIWKDCLNRFIGLCAPIIRNRGLDVKVGGVLMDYSWTSGTFNYWNWWDEIDQTHINEIVFGIDLYWHFTSSGALQSPNARVAQLLAEMRSAGIKHFSCWETNVDRRQTISSLGAPITGTEAGCTTSWNDFATLMNNTPESRMICEYHIPTGPASAQAWLMGNGAVSGGANNTGGTLKKFADICMAGRRL